MTATMSRKSFIKASAVAGGSAAMGAAFGGAISAHAEEASGEGGSTGALTADSVRGQKWAFEIPPQAIEESEISTTKEADVVVVGAGTSGLCAAISAAEEGLSVILFAMGAAPVGRGGSNFAFHSKYRESLGLEPINPSPYLYHHMLGCTFDIDEDKWFKWYQNSETTMNWLIDIMAETGEYDLNLEQYTHDYIDDELSPEYTPLGTHGWFLPDSPAVGDGQPLVTRRLGEKAAELGVTLDYNTRAVQLVRGGVCNGTEGRVDAVVAIDPDGNYVKYVGSKAIVLATGDFSRDRDMVAKYAPQAYDWITNFDAGDDFDPEAGKIYGGLYTGDGQKMGLWVGAAWQKAYPNAAMAGTRFAGADDIGFLVNSKGKRFMNESLCGTYATNQYKHVFGKTVYEIWDTAYATAGDPWPKRKTGYLTPLMTPEEVIEDWETKVADGTYYKADTLEELIEQMGLPAETLEEIEKYNGYAQAGEDLEFFKRPEFLHTISEPPFYGAVADPSKPTFLCLMGGLRTDLDMRVCDADDNPIPGLYNVGTMVGDCYGNVYSLKLGGHNLGMNCICFGYLTGKFIAENE